MRISFSDYNRSLLDESLLERRENSKESEIENLKDARQEKWVRVDCYSVAGE
jgi:hypothetical protein